MNSKPIFSLDSSCITLSTPSRVSASLSRGLRGGQDVEVFAVFVFNQGLVECGFALDDVDEVIHDAAFATHNQVEVAQTDVEVDYGGFVAAQGQAGCDAGAGSGLAYAAFT